MLYEPTQFEPPIDEPWDQARVEAAISEIVAAAALALEISASAAMATAGSAEFFRAHHERGGLR